MQRELYKHAATIGQESQTLFDVSTFSTAAGNLTVVDNLILRSKVRTAHLEDKGDTYLAQSQNDH